MDNKGLVLNKYVCVALFTVLSSVASANSFEEGCTAFRAGDRTAAERMWLPLAQKGDVNAQFGMAVIQEDEIKRNYWTALAAEQGHAEACFWMYRKNWLDEEDKKGKSIGLEWLEKSAENGNPEAAMELGVILTDGIHIPKDCVRGMHYLEMAAELDYPEAPGWLAGEYRSGDCTAPDDSLATKWTFRAAELGDPIAVQHMVRIYNEGIGVPKDEYQVVKWLAVWNRELSREDLPSTLSLSADEFSSALSQAAEIRERFEKRPSSLCP